MRPGDVFVDVGANIGVYTVLCALRGARVLAFEPNADARSLLVANVTLNAIDDRVEVSSFALADFSGTSSFTTELEEGNHLARESDVAGQSVEVRELDRLPLPPGDVTLIKVDAEGFDEAVLRGASATIVTHRPVLLIETWAGGHSIRRFLAKLGYRFFLYRSSLVAVDNEFSEDANLIAVHSERVDWVEERLRTTTPRPHRAAKVRWLRHDPWLHDPRGISLSE
jgi:FkbM family methyltransferase